MIRLATFAAATTLYVISMLLLTGPPEQEGAVTGYLAFFLSFLSLFEWLKQGGLRPSPWILLLFVAWIANPVFWVGLWLHISKKPKSSAQAGTLSVCLACAPLSLVLSAPNNPAYWTWIASFAVLAIGSACCMRRPSLDLVEPVSPVDFVDERIQR
jgi:hypothetical protein